MGLALVHGIVKSYGGGVYVHSQVDQGTTFDILLPRIEKSPEHEFAQEEPLARGNETILFVDDETMIVGLAQKMLESLGYHVIPKTVAAEALELFTQIVQIDPGHASVHNNLGVVYWHMGELDKALECLSRSLQIDPTHRHALDNYRSVVTAMVQAHGQGGSM